MSDQNVFPWLEGLNPPQREACVYDGGPMLIVAGAGSGKTRAIVHRIVHLIKGRGADPRSILAVTFTNKAAEEMQNRVRELLGADAGGMWVSTFHSFGAQVLRRHIEVFGYSRAFAIYDESDQNSLLKKVIKEHGYDPKALTPRELKTWIEYVKREALSAKEIEERTDARSQRNLPLLVTYQDRLRESNALDFSDLILLTQRLFEKHPEILAEYRARFQHFLIDEYQDTNRVQYLLIRQLVGNGGDICIVGDEDQSIYGWRGADIRNILRFEEDFPGAKVIMLEQNYRSTRNVIEAASELINRNAERKEKKLWTANQTGALIKLHAGFDDKDEASFVAAEIQRLREKGRALRDIAVFYRAHAQSRLLEDALRGKNIPHAVYGGPRFYDRMEIKDALAYLRFIVNPADEISLLRIINTPARGIGQKTIERIEAVRRQGSGDWLEAVRTFLESAGAGKALAGIRAFLEMMDTLIAKRDTAPAALAEMMLEMSGYRKMYENEIGQEAKDRVQNLAELVTAIADYESEAEAPTLAGFIEKVSLAQDMDRFDPESGSVSLMTLHSAKGLEFPVVFMVGMDEGVFPHPRSLSDEEREGMSALEEERRLCYVGMTRAREQLYLTRADTRSMRGYFERTSPSMFLAEIPKRFLEPVSGGSLRPPRALRPEPASARRSGPPPSKRTEDFGDSRIVYDEGADDQAFHHPSGFDLKPGDRVWHKSYGEGVIKRFEDSGEKMKVVVKFAQGSKKFLAAFAALTPL